MQIREIDVYDDADFYRAYDIQRAADLFERPDAPVWSREEAAVAFRKPVKSEKRVLYGAYDDGEMVGTAAVFLPQLDNTNMTWAGVFVEPERRRHGIGGALVEHLVAQSGRDNRPVVLVESAVPFERRADHPHILFATKHGFTAASTEVRRRLSLPVDDADIQGWIDEAAPSHSAYQVVTYVGPLPEEVLPSYCRVINRLSVDAPSGDIEFEEEAMTPEHWREEEAVLAEMGRTLVNTLALDSSGEAVAVSTLAVPEHDKPKVYQWTTLVLREHRGHRLGLATKAANLREVQLRYPDRTQVWTWNHEENSYMVSINEKLGFVPDELSIEFQRKLSANCRRPG